MPQNATETTEAPPLLIPVRVVAKLLGISVRSVWRLHSAGKFIQPIRIGSLVRWRKTDLERWIAEGCPNSTDGRRQR